MPVWAQTGNYGQETPAGDGLSVDETSDGESVEGDSENDEFNDGSLEDEELDSDASEDEESDEEELETEEPDDVNPNEDPQWGREQGYGIEEEYYPGDGIPALGLSPTSGYKHNARFDGYDVQTGIDVSYYQNNINWSAVAADGVDFAFIRVGFRGYGASGSLNSDTKYDANIRGALAAGIPVGVYFFSQAITPAEAAAEARYVIDRIGSYDITLPVIMDFEYASGAGGNIGRLYNAHLTKAQATDVCLSFCETVEAAGYDAMVYANKSLLTSGVDASRIAARYQIWLANYTKETTYAGDYSYWQYTSSGSVNGISGNVDLDFGYTKPYKIAYYLGSEEAVNGDNPRQFYPGTGIKELEIPVWDGHIFEGWFTEPEFVNEIEYIDTQNIRQDLNIYAKWMAPQSLPVPEFSHTNALSLPEETRIELGCPARNASIYYTFSPSEAAAFDVSRWTLYQDALELTMDITNNPSGEQGAVTIYAIAVEEGYINSDIVSHTYLIDNPQFDWGDITEADRLEAGLSSVADIPSGLWMLGIEDYEYTGSPLTQDNLRVYYNSKRLIKNQNYTCKYADNTKAGTATITISGRGIYKGSITQTYEIAPISIADAYLSSSSLLLSYTGKVQKGAFALQRLLSNGKRVALKKGIDYDVEYIGLDGKTAPVVEGAFLEPGTYTIHVTGRGNYTSTSYIDIPLTISAARLITRASISVSAVSYQGGAPVYPAIKVKENGHLLEGYLSRGAGSADEALAEVRGLAEADKYKYVYYFANNCSAKTSAKVYVVGIEENGYAGVAEKTFAITGISIKKATIDRIEEYEYTGSPICPAPVVRYEGRVLKGISRDAFATADSTQKATYEYMYSFADNTNKGTAKVYIEGVNAFYGSSTVSFKIKGLNIAEAIATEAPEEGKVTISLGSTGQIGVDATTGLAMYKYTKGGVKPAVEVRFKLSDGNYLTLKERVDYTVSYSEYNAAGVAKIYIRGKRQFKGLIIQEYQIVQSDLNEAIVKASDIVYQDKSGAYKSTPVVTDSSGRRLVQNVDYRITGYTYAESGRVTYKVGSTYKTRFCHAGDLVRDTDVLGIGTRLNVVVAGIGNYSGTNKISYTLARATIKQALGTISPQIYTGKQIRPTKSDIHVYIGGQELSKNDYRIVGYSNNTKVGKAGVTIAGLGEYTGTKTIYFRIKR